MNTEKHIYLPIEIEELMKSVKIGTQFTQAVPATSPTGWGGKLSPRTIVGTSSEGWHWVDDQGTQWNKHSGRMQPQDMFYPAQYMIPIIEEVPGASI